MSALLIVIALVAIVLVALRVRKLRADAARSAGLDPAALGLELTEGANGRRSLRGERRGHLVEIDLTADSTRVHLGGAAHMFSAREELGALVASPHTPRRVRQALEETRADEGRIWSGVQIEADGSGVLVRREGSRGNDFWPHYLRLAERLVDIRPDS